MGIKSDTNSSVTSTNIHYNSDREDALDKYLTFSFDMVKYGYCNVDDAKESMDLFCSFYSDQIDLVKSYYDRGMTIELIYDYVDDDTNYGDGTAKIKVHEVSYYLSQMEQERI